MDTDAPLYETGEYKASIRYVVAPGMVAIGSDLHYAADLEYGNSRQVPRPIYKNALMKVLPTLGIMLDKLYLKRLRRG